MKLIKDIILYGFVLPLILIVAPLFDLIFYVVRGVCLGLMDALSSTASLYSDISVVYKDRWAHK